MARRVCVPLLACLGLVVSSGCARRYVEISRPGPKQVHVRTNMAVHASWEKSPKAETSVSVKTRPPSLLGSLQRMPVTMLNAAGSVVGLPEVGVKETTATIQDDGTLLVTTNDEGSSLHWMQQNSGGETITYSSVPARFSDRISALFGAFTRTLLFMREDSGDGAESEALE